MTLSLDINQILEAKGVYVRNEWIEAAVDFVQHQTVSDVLTTATLADKVSHTYLFQGKIYKERH